MLHSEQAEQTEFRVRYYIVCLIDVLGQKRRLKDWARLPTGGEVTEELIEALKGTVGAVLALRDMFKNYFSQFRRGPREETLARLGQDKQDLFMRMRQCDLSTQQFSDTFVFYAPIANHYGDLSSETFYQMLTAAATAMLCALAGHAPIRGAITVGAGTEIAPGNFYGPALAEAYRLESEIADYPRVVLSHAAVAFALQASGFSVQPEIERVSAAFQQRHIRPLLCNDGDQQVIVDFMCREIRSGVADAPAVLHAASEAYAFVRSELAEAEIEGNNQLISRYSRLLEYMQSRLSIWGITN